MLCKSPAEHLRLPDLNDVKEGIIASKIAAHAADIAKGIPHARDKDNEMAAARHKLDWEEMFKAAADPDKARATLRAYLRLTVIPARCAARCAQSAQPT